MLTSEMMFCETKGIWDKYITHPFIVEMAEGNLDIKRFRKYMLQDYLYLKDYVKVFAAILMKAKTMDETVFLANNIKAVVDETLRVHVPYMEKIGLRKSTIEKASSNITNLGYTNYMFSVAMQESFVEGIVAILACSWSYAYIAKTMVDKYPKALEHKLYGAWFNGYCCKEYQSVNKELIAYIDKLTENYSKREQERCVEIFKNCSLFELEFWNMSYKI